MDDDTPLTDDMEDVAVDGTDVRADGMVDMPAMGGDTLDVSGDVPVESDVPPVSVPGLPKALLPGFVESVDPVCVINGFVAPSIVFDAPGLDRLDAAMLEPVTLKLERPGLGNPGFDMVLGTHGPAGAERVVPGTAGLGIVEPGTFGLVCTPLGVRGAWPAGLVESGGVVCICAASATEAHARDRKLNTGIFMVPPMFILFVLFSFGSATK